jgi:hypothetical protein
VIREGMRRELGGSFRLVRGGWAGLVLTLGLALWWALDAQAMAGVGVALVACALLGWLTSFLFGILQRIVPFLVAMHLAGTQRRAPTPSSLTDERALSVHRRCHAAALALLALAVAIDSAALALAASAVGAVGALGFGAFLIVVVRRTRRSLGAERDAQHQTRRSVVIWPLPSLRRRPERKFSGCERMATLRQINLLVPRSRSRWGAHGPGAVDGVLRLRPEVKMHRMCIYKRSEPIAL